MNEPRRPPTETPEQSGAEMSFGPATGPAEPVAVHEPSVQRPVAAHTKKVAGAFQDLATPTNVALVAAALVLLLIGALGGWKNLADQKAAVATVPAGQEFAASPFKVTLIRGLSFSQQPDILTLREGERALMIGADVTNTSDKSVSVYDLARAFRISAAELTNFGTPMSAAEAKPTVKRASDSLDLTMLQPGLKTRLALIWVQNAARPAPSSVTVTVFKQTYRQSALDGSMGYFDPTETAQIKLPMQALGQTP